MTTRLVVTQNAVTTGVMSSSLPHRSHTLVRSKATPNASGNASPSNALGVTPWPAR